jgi:hypothetical protein
MRLSKMLDGIQAAVTDCQALLEESMPKASESEKRAALTEALRLEHEAFELGVATD